jgi:Domain of unknown function (DUF6980)
VYNPCVIETAQRPLGRLLVKVNMAHARHHCCETMNAQITHHCHRHADIFSYPDALIGYEPRFDQYGIIIHDRGRSSLTIHYCPWCGTALPDSRRDRWFVELAALVFDDPMRQPILEAFTTDAWYRHKPSAAPARGTV